MGKVARMSRRNEPQLVMQFWYPKEY